MESVRPLVQPRCTLAPRRWVRRSAGFAVRRRTALDRRMSAGIPGLGLLKGTLKCSQMDHLSNQA